MFSKNKNMSPMPLIPLLLSVTVFCCLTLCFGERDLRNLLYKNCGTHGNITTVQISNCETNEESPCIFYAGDELALDYEYVTDRNFTNLDFHLNLIEKEDGTVFPIRYTLGTLFVTAYVPQSSYIRVLLNDTIPPGRMWDMEIVRKLNHKEVCAKFPVHIDPIEETTTTTTTTVEPPTSTPSPPDGFQCEEIGYFPDPSDCTVFHECQLFLNGTLWDTVQKCPEFTVWCQETRRCEYDNICHCQVVELYNKLF